MRAIGIGCRAGRPAEAVLAVIAQAIAGLSPGRSPLMICTSAAKLSEPGIVQAARRLGLPLQGFPPDVLAAQRARLMTLSARVEAVTGLPGIAEAAALAAVGPLGTLILPRFSLDGVTGAVAEDRP